MLEYINSVEGGLFFPGTESKPNNEIFYVTVVKMRCSSPFKLEMDLKKATLAWGKGLEEKTHLFHMQFQSP